MKICVTYLFSFCFFALIFGEEPKKIGIFTYRVLGMPPWDPDSVKLGIPGSEEATIYISQELAQLGYQVVVFGQPPLHSSHSQPSANPRFLDVCMEPLFENMFDVAIAWRMPDAAKRLRKYAKKVYLWPHDTIHHVVPLEQIESFNDVLWLSKWQREQWISINPAFGKFTSIFGNGLTVDPDKPISKKYNPHACIYGSNYARGLEILLEIWPAVRKEFPESTLDIYYGWQHWGLLSNEREAKMREQVSQLVSQGVVDHGMVNHAQLEEAYGKASIWTYPCIAPETFCITGLRAQYAGAVPVIIEGSALAETVRWGYRCKTKEEYLPTLLKAMKEVTGISLIERQKNREFIEKEFTWKIIAKKWKELFDAQPNQETQTLPQAL
jgi:glycosyltransferase involved in cell wall biosynthesis